MGSAAKRQVIQQFLETGRFEPSAEEAMDQEVPDVPLDLTWLVDIQQRRQWLAASPETELPLYQELYKDPNLTQEDVDRLLKTIEDVLTDPEGMYDAIEQESVFGTIKDVASCAAKIPKWYWKHNAPSPDELAKIAALRETYKLPAVDINPNDHRLEFCDPGWWHLIKAKASEMMKLWPRGLAPFIEHGGGKTFVYERNEAISKVALMADFGVGHYHSYCIAHTLEKQAYPYVFHLGDVYYGGSAEEFATNYSAPLDGVMNKSTLFSLPENHELYGGGVAYQTFLRTERGKKRIIQEGSYFCMRFPKHQFVGIDVNWNGRQRFQRKQSREWLSDVIRTGRTKGLTTILLTGSAPYAYGSQSKTKLYDDMVQWSEQGDFDMWFWGDDHYCALFDRDVNKAPFVGSCIGHGGYPGTTQKKDLKSFVGTTWVESETRFPHETGLRPDLGNNGWVEFTMLDSGGVELTYVDWLGSKRFWAKYEFERTNAFERHLKLVDQKSFGRTTPL